MDNQCEKPRRCPPPLSNINKAERTKMIRPIPTMTLNKENITLLTTYQTEFYPRHFERAKAYPTPHNPIKTTGRMETESRYRMDYHWHPMEATKASKSLRDKEYRPPTLPMNAFSNYRLDYPGKFGEPAKSAKRKQFIDAKPPHMADISTYKYEFVHHCMPDRISRKTRAEQLADARSICCAFSGITTYKRDYLPNNNPCPSKIIKQLVTPKPNPGCFADQTTYRVSYEPYYYDDGQGGGPPANCDPPKMRDKCEGVRCFSEPERKVNEGQRPTPPCPCPPVPAQCPNSQDFRCAPRIIPCISPYKMETKKDYFTDATHITLENNTNGDLRAGYPAEIQCPLY